MEATIVKQVKYLDSALADELCAPMSDAELQMLSSGEAILNDL